MSCQKDKTLLFVGSYTDKKPGVGVSVFEFDTETGTVNMTFEMDGVTNTSFLRLAPNGKYIYSVADSQMEFNGKVAAYSVDSEKGSISLINMQDCGGRNPVHLEIDNNGKYLVNSNYTDPSLSIFKINTDGSLNKFSQLITFKDSSVIKSRQKSAHIHSSNFSPESNNIFVHDLGADKIRIFELDQKGEPKLINENQLKVTPGSGPRHFTFHPNGKFAYGIFELSGKIAVFSYENGELEFLEDHESYSRKQEIYSAADIHISPDGLFLYASNRGPEEDSISIFSINKESGKLSLVERESTYGEHPRNFVIDPSGKFLLVANQHSNSVIVFKRDLKSGKLTKLPTEIKVGNPASLQMYNY